MSAPAPNHVRPSQVIIVGARMTEDVLSLVRDVEEAFAARVRAEAVAEERQRLLDGANPARVEAIREVGSYIGPNLAGWPAFPVAYFGGLVDRVVCAYVRAAGSVPVATPRVPCHEVSALPPRVPCDREQGHEPPHNWPAPATAPAGPVARCGEKRPQSSAGAYWLNAEQYDSVALCCDEPAGHAGDHRCDEGKPGHDTWPNVEARSAAEPSVGTGTPAEAVSPASVAQDRRAGGLTEYVLLTERCTSRDCGGRVVYSELTDNDNTHWHVKPGASLVRAGAVSGGSGHAERQASASDDELTRLRTFTAAVDQMLGDMDAAELRAEVHRLMETREEWLRQAATVWEPARFALLVNERDEAVAEVARCRAAIEKVLTAAEIWYRPTGESSADMIRRALPHLLRPGFPAGWETTRQAAEKVLGAVADLLDNPPAAALRDGAEPGKGEAGWMGPPDEFAQSGDGA